MVKSFLIFLVSLLHICFLILEMFLWTKPIALKVFRMTPTQAQDQAVLAANQGLYNGFLAAGLFWSLLHPDSQVADQLAFFFLSCVIIAALYGAYSANRKILLVQGIPALVALLGIFLL